MWQKIKKHDIIELFKPFRGNSQDGRVKEPEITFSHGHTKITIIYEAIIDKKKKDQNLPEKIFYNESYKDKTTIRQVWGLESWYSSQDPYPLVK